MRDVGINSPIAIERIEAVSASSYCSFSNMRAKCLLFAHDMYDCLVNKREYQYFVK